jgi:hypothetical protein
VYKIVATGSSDCPQLYDVLVNVGKVGSAEIEARQTSVGDEMCYYNQGGVLVSNF